LEVSAAPEVILGEIIKRDELDSSRAISPLRQAEDAILIDASDMTVDQVVQKILEIVGH
jgi:cytidylate kinase